MRRLFILPEKAEPAPGKVVNGTFGDLWDAPYRQSPYRDISLNRSLTACIVLRAVVTSRNLFGCVPLWKSENACTNGDFRFYSVRFYPDVSGSKQIVRRFPARWAKYYT